MTIYARIQSGTVAELFAPSAGFTIAECFAPSVAAQFSDVTTVSPVPEAGWTATETNGAWTFTAPPAPPAPTLAQLATTALSAGLTITSTSTSALNGTYDVSAASQSHMQAEMIALLNSGGTTFADGAATVVWPDMAGANHTFSAGEGKALFLAVGSFVASLYKCINGTLGTLPPSSTTIA